MHKVLIPFSAVPQLSRTDVAYAEGATELRPFYCWEPTLDRLPDVLTARSGAAVPREVLAAVLAEQYARVPTSERVLANIEALQGDRTFCITTAHQPTLLLGPLYFLYKAISTIRLAEVAERRLGHRIVPVFVLGSEDHDLEELNHVRLFGRELRWEPGMGGPVGRLPTRTLQPVLEALRPILGDSELARQLWQMICAAYQKQPTFAESTRALLNSLFGRYGLVVADLSDARLKRHFLSVMRDELLNQTAHRLVSETLERLRALGFKEQAPPRVINLFYLQEGSRERIVQEGDTYRVLNTPLAFSRDVLLAELEAYPERFSPNVVLRPLYQEMVLPNLAYVGGGGELAYWLERRSLFEHYGVPYPMLVRRHSVLWFDKDALKRSLKFAFPPQRYFDDPDTLVRDFVATRADASVDLSTEIAELRALYERIARRAKAIDPTLESAVRADAVKAAGQIEHWQGRLLRAEKQKHDIAIGQLRALRDKLFPGGQLQERVDNFIPYYLKYGEQFIETLMEHLTPFEPGFVLLQDT
ncbi:MAG: bacillithiol biosynthesis cysteine-adding enzyme BshC [Saprospiraceae bacterium]|nr:bacillithiol biosynthesis cysteine-adding enzyme BshC [Saprospiraceae bacterium]MDW8230109.1 bacillithiol biosynthesis cysteine-adding enzyme BshC [Saprospiraceae bacterium]